jgi:hypothetical protein
MSYNDFDSVIELDINKTPEQSPRKMSCKNGGLPGIPNVREAGDSDESTREHLDFFLRKYFSSPAFRKRLYNLLHELLCIM